jgi:glycosyltransferase involved in cell wall biosynthesis
MMQVSFVIPCYNYGRYLGDCLRSIFAQQGGYEFDIIAIDDASTDDTPAVLSSFADPRLRVVTHEVNMGHVATVNEGLAAARGRYVARIDADDRYRPNFLATLLPKFELSPRIGMVYGDACVIDGEGRINVDRCDRVHGGRDFVGNELTAILENNFICAPTAIARREAWQANLPIWEGLAFNDWYFNVQFARAYDFCYVNEVVADYRVHARNHHARIVLDRTEEASIVRVLDHVFGQQDQDADLESRKQRSRGRIYAAQYLTLAEKYFGAGMYADARRCYWQTWRYQPGRILRFGPLRRLLATYLGQKHYEFCKRLMVRTQHA